MIAIGTLAIIGRLISVEEFGLFAVVLIFKNLLSPVMDFALSPAYIKLEQIDEKISSAFFTVNLYISIFAALVMLVFAWPSVYFFGDIALKPLILISAIAVFFSSMSGQPIAILKRAKRFDLLAKIELFMSLSGAVFVCVLAYRGYGVWALVWRTIFEAICRTGMLACAAEIKFSIIPWKDLAQYKTNFIFAAQIVISRIPNRVILTLDKIFVGKFLGTEALGFYSRASQLTQMVDTNLGKPISSPALSYMARLENRIDAHHYISLLWVTYLFAGLGCLLLILFGDQLLPLLMGNNWIPAGILLQFFGIWGIGKIFHTLSVSYHINEMKMARWTRCMVIAIPLIYLPPLMAMLIESSLASFTFIYALSYCFYWFSIYFFSLYSDYKNSGRLLTETAVKIVVIFSMTIYLSQQVLKITSLQILVLESELAVLVLKIMLSCLIYFALFLLLANNERKVIFKILNKK